MDITEIEKIGVIIHSAVFRNDEHKNILREMLLGITFLEAAMNHYRQSGYIGRR